MTHDATQETNVPGIGSFFRLDDAFTDRDRWERAEPATSKLFLNEIPIYVVVPPAEPLERANLSLVARVLGDLDPYLIEALRFAHATMLSQPHVLGMNPEDVESRRDFRPENVPLAGPLLTFGRSDEWFVDFSEAEFPAGDPDGMEVLFRELVPVGIKPMPRYSGPDD